MFFLTFKTTFVHNMLWTCIYEEFNEQSLVIMWAKWFKNESFWKRFTCTTSKKHFWFISKRKSTSYLKEHFRFISIEEINFLSTGQSSRIVDYNFYVTKISRRLHWHGHFMKSFLVLSVGSILDFNLITGSNVFLQNIPNAGKQKPWGATVQVNIFQKFSFLRLLTHHMATHCCRSY